MCPTGTLNIQTPAVFSVLRTIPTGLAEKLIECYEKTQMTFVKPTEYIKGISQ